MQLYKSGFSLKMSGVINIKAPPLSSLSPNMGVGLKSESQKGAKYNLTNKY